MEKTIAGNFDEFGFPFLQIQVMNLPAELSVRVKAIVDTGAAHCLIREETAQQLKLEELRTADYRHPVFGRMPLKEYLMNVRLGESSDAEGRIIRNIRAGTLVDPHYPADVILGVELLQHLTIHYDGPKRSFYITLDE